MKCKAKTATGARCKAQPMKGKEYCFIHSPETGRARAEARRKGGENRHTPHAGDPSTIPANINSLETAGMLLNYTLQELLVMDNSIPRARALLQAYEMFLKSIEIGELEQRIQALELMRK